MDQDPVSKFKNISEKTWLAIGAGAFALALGYGLWARSRSLQPDVLADRKTNSSVKQLSESSDTLASSVITTGGSEAPTESTQPENSSHDDQHTDPPEGAPVDERPPTAAAKKWDHPSFGFSVAVPSSWTESSTSFGSTTSFRYSGPSGVELHVDVTPTASKDPAATPHRLAKAFSASRLRRLERSSLGNMTADRLEGSRWEFQLSSRNRTSEAFTDSMHKVAGYFIKNGREYAVMFQTLTSTFEERKHDWADIVKSLRFTATSAPAATSTPAVPKPQASASKGEGDIALDLTSKFLTESDLSGLSKWQLDLARNTPYARRGLLFRRADLRGHFESLSWYHGSTTDQVAIHEKLSPTEKANVVFIYNYQVRRHMLP